MTISRRPEIEGWAATLDQLATRVREAQHAEEIIEVAIEAERLSETMMGTYPITAEHSKA